MASASPPCPVCDGAAPMLDVVDFNKCCEEVRGKFLPLSGRPVYYHRCAQCAFTFAPEFQHWSEGDFLQHIYNDGYVDVDPDYRDARPLENMALVRRFFETEKSQLRHLDYGGGNGRLSELLREQGWDSQSYDPFPANEQALGSLGRFNLITAFEVFEHVPDVNRLLAHLKALMDQPCLVLFSTLTSDGHIQRHRRLNWWYAAPRNGHISLYSELSLKLLALKNGLKYCGLGVGYHCYMNRFPAWARAMAE